MKEFKIGNSGIGELILRPSRSPFTLAGRVAAIHIYDYDDDDSTMIQMTKDQVKDLITALQTYVKE